MGNEIRRQRTEQYFIDAACKLIKENGVRAATIRNIAEKAGYNSATLYSYFDNLGHLLLRASLVFEEELLHRMMEDERIKSVIKLKDVWPFGYSIMATYYLENPNIFDCVFVEKLGENINELRKMRQEESKFAHYTEGMLFQIANELHISPQIVMEIHEACLALTVGIVLLCTKERFDRPIQQIVQTLEKQICCIINAYLEEENLCNN